MISNIVQSNQFSLGSLSGLVLWLRADAGVTTSSNLVTTWADQSTSRKNATAAGVGRPTYNSTSWRGMPGIEFDGVSNSMSGSSNIFTSSDDYTIFVVSRRIALPAVGTEAPQFLPRYAGGHVPCLATYNSGGKPGVFKSGYSWHPETNVVGTTTPLCQVTRKIGTDTIYRRDGDQLLTLTGAETGGNNGAYMIGGYPSNLPACVLFEIIAVLGGMSTDSIIAVEGYLRSKWTI